MRWRNSDASNKKYRRNRCEISSHLKALRFSVCWISRWTSIEWRWPSGMTLISLLVLGVELYWRWRWKGDWMLLKLYFFWLGDKQTFSLWVTSNSTVTIWWVHLPLSSLNWIEDHCVLSVWSHWVQFYYFIENGPVSQTQIADSSFY